MSHDMKRLPGMMASSVTGPVLRQENVIGPEEYEARLASELAADLLRQAVWGCTQNDSKHPDPSALVHWANRVADEWADKRREKIKAARGKDAGWHEDFEAAKAETKATIQEIIGLPPHVRGELKS